MMQVKRYVAPTFAEALIAAKNELGPEALIVETRKLRKGGLFGLFGRVMTEVTAAADKSGKVPLASVKLPTQPQAPAHGAPAAPLPRVAVESGGGSLGELEREIKGLRSMMTRLLQQEQPHAAHPVLSGPGQEIYDRLRQRGVADEVAREIGQRVGEAVEGGEGPAAALELELARILRPAPVASVSPGRRKVIALTGPTGVGKTTTLAKLAARYTMQHGLRVALVTCDTFRIAAIEQLRTYADILGVPLYTVDTPQDAADAMAKTRGYDLVLVDTAGRSHRDQPKMAELGELLTLLRPDETHLVVSLTASSDDARMIMDAYLPLGANRLTLTKLDEAAMPGSILNLTSRCGQPLGYVTTGQSVPDDILPAATADFRRIVLGV